MKCFAWALVFVLVSPAVFSQYGKEPDLPYGLYRVAARFNFTGLADPVDNNISAGAEYALNAHWSAILDIAYIEYSKYFYDVRRTRGYILKPALRYYPLVQHRGFIEVAGMYKHATYHITDWLGRDCINGVPVYEEFTRFRYGKRVVALNIQTGIQADLTPDRRLRFEGYIGLGVRSRNQDVAGQTNSCYNQTRSFFDINGISGTSVTSNFTAGMRLIFGFLHGSGNRTHAAPK